MTEIPNISKVNSGTDHQGDSFAEAWFTNGARLRYTRETEKEYGEIIEEVFAPSDPHSVMERHGVARCDKHPDATVAGCLVESLDVLADFESVEELQQDWPTLGEWITHE